MITKINLRDIPGRATSYNELVTDDIKTFIESEWNAAEVSCAKYKTPKSAYGVYRKTIEKYFPNEASMAMRGDRLFIIRNR